jgi:hypothetical protein
MLSPVVTQVKVVTESIPLDMVSTSWLTKQSAREKSADGEAAPNQLPPRRAGRKTSSVWKHGYEVIVGDAPHWKCLVCESHLVPIRISSWCLIVRRWPHEQVLPSIRHLGVQRLS